MGISFYIVLDKPEVDAFVNGKTLAREGRRLARVAKSIGVKSLDDYVSYSAENLAAAAEDFEIEGEVLAADEQWFDADEGIGWVSSLRNQIQVKPGSVKDPEGVLSDLAEYERVLILAKNTGARWHLAIEY